MKFTLRSYQTECINTVCQGFDDGLTSQLVQLPTGAGKTVIFWHLIKKRGDRALIIAPTIELTEQVEQTGQVVCPEANIWRKNSSYWKHGFDHCVLTTQSATWALKNGHLDDFNPTLLVIDEAHKSRSPTLEALIKHYASKGVPTLGLTATPERLDGKSLMETYEKITYKKNLLELIKAKHLVDLRCYRIKTGVSVGKLKYRSGDISPVSLQELDIEERNKIISALVSIQLQNKKTLIFCLSVEHSRQLASDFVSHGMKAAYIHGGMSQKERRSILERFSSGEIQVLCNCQLLTEGFDEPTIEALILARPTKSKVLYCQMIGRGVRPSPGKKHCIVYDLSDEIHNICSFNVLGNLPMNTGYQIGDDSGERLSEGLEKARNETHVDVVDFEYFRPYIALDEFPATDSQLEVLDRIGFPYHDGITMPQAAYLIFKNRMFEEYGLDRNAYWKEWSDDIQSPNTPKGWSNYDANFQRLRNSLYVGQISRDADQRIA